MSISFKFLGPPVCIIVTHIKFTDVYKGFSTRQDYIELPYVKTVLLFTSFIVFWKEHH